MSSKDEGVTQEPALRKLKWGETPWDTLSRKEMITELMRLSLAVEAGYDVIRYCKDREAVLPFWGTDGRGGCAVEMLRQCIEAGPVSACDSESVYHTYARYARDLLFDASIYRRINGNWMICDICGWMYGASHNKEGDLCSNIIPKECTGKLRKIVWDDLKEQGESEVSE